MTQDFAWYDYDIHIPSSKRYTKLFQDTEMLIQAAMQNGQATLEAIAKMTLTDSVAERIQILRDSSQEMQERRMESEKLAAEAGQKREEMEYRKHREELDTRIEVALIDAEVKDRDSERKNERIDTSNEDSKQISMHNDKMSLERDKLAEQRRSNKAKEQIARSKPKSSQQK
jgi:hypothetical protein